jgi:serine/threonine-protein kinase
MLVMHAHQKPVPPSKRLASLAEGRQTARNKQPIHEELEALVMACLDKNPNRRPQTARELADALSSLRFQTPWDEDAAELWWTQHEGPPPAARRTADPEEMSDAAEPAIPAAPVSRTF